MFIIEISIECKFKVTIENWRTTREIKISDIVNKVL